MGSRKVIDDAGFFSRNKVFKSPIGRYVFLYVVIVLVLMTDSMIISFPFEYSILWNSNIIYSFDIDLME